MTRIAPRLLTVLALIHAHAFTIHDAVLAQTASRRPTAQEVGNAADAFGKRPVKEQVAVATALRAELDAMTTPTAPALRACIAAAATASAPRTTAFPHREPKKRGSKPDPRRDSDLLQRSEYVFGLGIIEHHAIRPTKKPQLPAWEAAERRHLVHTALLGMLPDADLAVAELLRTLDGDTSADRFAAFLESWRNGEESFYEALDRTAGTADSVFFYDAMLHDFTGVFAKDSTEGKALAGLGDAHDALHSAFLSYRQYRAFREAIAWSLVLPPDLPLPRCLARYEAKVPGGYSLRQQVAMVLATLDYDAVALAKQIASTAAPLPVPLWKETYDPYPQWTAIFQAAMPRMIEQAGDTDKWLARVEQELSTASAAVRAAVAKHLGAKPAPN